MNRIQIRGVASFDEGEVVGGPGTPGSCSSPIEATTVTPSARHCGHHEIPPRVAASQLVT